MARPYPRAGAQYPRSLGEFRAWFQTDADCLDYLEWLRWPSGFVCPTCGNPAGWRTGDDRIMCAGCGSGTSVTTGAVFDRTRTPLNDLVCCLLAFCHWQGRDLGAELEAHARDRFLSDGLGDPPSASLRAGPAREGAPERKSGSGRDLYQRCGAGVGRETGTGEEGADGYRG